MKNKLTQLLFIAVLFSACKKDVVEKPTPTSVNNCGTIVNITGTDVSSTTEMIFKIDYAITVNWSNGTTSTVHEINGNWNKGEQYCK